VRMRVDCTDSAAISSSSRTRCSRNVFHMCPWRTARPVSPRNRPSGSMLVAPAVLHTTAGPFGMAGGISSVDSSACFHGVAMNAGSDFICGNGPLIDDRLTRPLLGAGVWGRESSRAYLPFRLRGAGWAREGRTRSAGSKPGRSYIISGLVDAGSCLSNRVRSLPLEALHTHNKPPNTMLATTICDATPQPDNE
jgi:hypothetical protein